MTATTTTSTNNAIATNKTTAVSATKRRKPAAVSTAVIADAKTILRGDIVKMGTTEKDVSIGRNVSGRSWKVRKQPRASTLYKTKTNNRTQTWESRQAEKRARQEARELQTELQNAKRDAAIAKKERRLEQERRRQENEYQNAQKNMQKLNHGKLATTLKSLSKKQLRQIKKTRVNTKTGAVELVPAYAK